MGRGFYPFHLAPVLFETRVRKTGPGFLDVIRRFGRIGKVPADQYGGEFQGASIDIPFIDPQAGDDTHTKADGR